MKKKVIAIIIVLLAGAVGLFLWQTKVSAPNTPKEEAKQEKETGPVRSELTGLETTTEKAKRPITAVMVENSPEARPQSGLKDAGVVFEAVAEGGITRFVALYQEAQPDLIGPVRSIRPYFVEWAAGFDAGLAHVGGSELALKMVKSGDYVVDLDQFKAPEGIFWRSEDRVAPHNMYTKMSGLDKYMAKLDKKKSDFQSWDRQALKSDKTESDLPAAQAIRLPVSTGIFEVSYHYDTASKTYQRFQGGEAHQDRVKFHPMWLLPSWLIKNCLEMVTTWISKRRVQVRPIFSKTAKSRKAIGPNQMHKQISASPTTKEIKSRSSLVRLG